MTCLFDVKIEIQNQLLIGLVFFIENKIKNNLIKRLKSIFLLYVCNEILNHKKMSNKKLKKGKGGLTVVHFDFESLSEKHIVKTGKPMSKGEFAKITGGSYELLPNWRKELPSYFLYL